MKVYGYEKGDNEEMLEMKEISFQAKPKRLRELANFLLKSADEIESSNKNQWDHVHLQDFIQDLAQEEPDIVIAHPDL